MSDSSTSSVIFDEELLNNEGEEVDYYAILNISRDASQEEITRAYRQSCLIFHPDRHIDSTAKKEAEKIFVKIKKAFTTLSDPHTRKIYDAVGARGLQLHDWQLVPHSNSSDGIRREYELLQKLRETEIMLQRVHPTGHFLCKFSLAGLFAGNSDERYPPQLTGISIVQNVECPLTTTEKIGLSGRLKVSNGNGDGSLVFHLKRSVSSYATMETSLILSPDNIILNGVFARSITAKSAIVLQPSLQYFLLHGSFSPGCSFAYTRGLDPQWQGTVAYHFGIQQSLTTTIIHSNLNQPNFITNLTVSPSNISLRTVYSKHYGTHDGILETSCLVGTGGIIPTISYERRFSRYSRIGINLSFAFPSYLLSTKLRVKTGTTTYDFKFYLCDNDEDLARAMLFGVVLPFIGFSLVKVAFRKTYDHIISLFEDQSELKEVDAIKREEAGNIMNLMRPQAERNANTEKAKGGLIIIEAKYGHMLGDGPTAALYPLLGDRVIDVTLALQALVHDSQLRLYSSKHQLPGFYDPCPFEPKMLRVIYKYRDEMHCIAIPEDMPLHIPNRNHRISSSNQ